MSNDKVILHVPDAAPQSSINDTIHEPYRLESCLCNRSTDKRLWILVVQTLLSLIIVVFSLYMLTDKDLDCEKSSLYSSLISLVFGWWIKSPLGS
jgi:hypothetical protein